MDPVALEISITTIIAVVSTVCAIYFAVKGHRRNQKQDDASEGSQNAFVMIKLESIGTQLTEMKAEFKAEFSALKEDTRADHDELIVLKSTVKTLWSMVDSLKINRAGGIE